MHVLTPDSMEVLERTDKNGRPYLQVKYYDHDANALSEAHYLNNQTSLKSLKSTSLDPTCENARVGPKHPQGERSD